MKAIRKSEVGLKGRQADTVREIIMEGLAEIADGGLDESRDVSVPGPRFPHDCDRCYCLGEYLDADLWMCPAQVGGPTVIARFGPDGDYRSGLPSADTDIYLAEAKRRAIEKGFLPG